MRLAAGYVVVLALLAIAAALSFGSGRERTAQPAIAGSYTGSAGCLGRAFTLIQSGTFVDAPNAKLRLDHERLTGDAPCGEVRLAVRGQELVGTVGGQPARAQRGATAAQVEAAPVKRSSEERFGRLMLAIAVVILVARLFGAALGRIGQPRVMGEVLAGILLGPTLLAQIAPGVFDYLFPPDIVQLLVAGADIGLAFYLFLVGMEIDWGALHGRVGQAAFVSNVSTALPLALGLLVALPLFEVLGPPVDYVPFALIIAVSMAITAFPVLARILTERRMLKQPVGALAITSAAIDDVTAWALLALATAIAGAGAWDEALVVIVLTAVFVAAMFLLVRPFLARVAGAYEELGYVPALWIGGIFVGVLLSAYVSQEIGVAAIFGAFVMGAIMPRHAGLTADVSRRLEDFVTMVLLPLFFVVTGLKVDVNGLNRPELWLLALALLAVAMIGKWLGAMFAARYTRLSWRDSTAMGALMNTRGLTELIVLNIGLELGLLSTSLFTMLVLMALVTTFLTGPALRWIDPRGELSAPPEADITPLLAGRSIVVAAQDERNLDPLLALAEPLARAEPPRELVLVELLSIERVSPGLAADDRELRRMNEELERTRASLRERGVTARGVAFTSSDAGADIVRLASAPDVDLLLVNGRRPLVGGGILAGAVGRALRDAPCDVAALVETGGEIVLSPARPVVAPFGGAPHDWAALELGAWLAVAGAAPLRLVGARAEGRDASRLLADASLVVQQMVALAPETVVTEDVLAATSEAGLLVIGLSERFKEEGLGTVRTEIVRRAKAPILFVRRGSRPGALAPSTDMTRFTWSFAGRIGEVISAEGPEHG